MRGPWHGASGEGGDKLPMAWHASGSATTTEILNCLFVGHERMDADLLATTGSVPCMDASSH